MSLTIDNPDWQGVREGFADDEIDFWDLPDQVTHFYPDQTFPRGAAEAKELDALIDDFFRIRRQSEELVKLMPHKSRALLAQFYDAVNEIESKIKKLLGNRVAFKPNSNRVDFAKPPVAA